jgi:methanogenic corrinoid protein MtbC1
MSGFSHDRTMKLADDYQQALLDGQRDKASALIIDALDDGLAIPSLYLDVFQLTQHRIGRLWQQNKVSVAVEHYSTAVTQLIMSNLFPRIVGDGSAGKTVVGCCVSSELHEMGMRMVCDFFEMNNWTTHFLGSGMPDADLVGFVRDKQADMVCISCTTSYNVQAVKSLVAALRDDAGIMSAIMVGGAPFAANPDLVALVGANATAADAREAVRKGWELVSS